MKKLFYNLNVTKQKENDIVVSSRTINLYDIKNIYLKVFEIENDLLKATGLMTKHLNMTQEDTGEAERTVIIEMNSGEEIAFFKTKVDIKKVRTAINKGGMMRNAIKQVIEIEGNDDAKIVYDTLFEVLNVINDESGRPEEMKTNKDIIEYIDNIINTLSDYSELLDAV